MQKKNEGMIERFCKYLGRQNSASRFLDYLANWMFPPPAFAYGGAGADMPALKTRKDNAGDILDPPKPIFMARPPAGSENFKGKSPTGPHAGHTLPTVPVPRWLSFIPLIGPILHVGAKKLAKHAKAACADPLYRGMHGAPCKFEGGSDNKCPKGTVSGWWWSYEIAGKGRVYYIDCCGGNPKHAVFCNWTSEPNWCVGYGKAQQQGVLDYNCTLAILEASMSVKPVERRQKDGSKFTNYEVQGVDP